MAIIMLKCSLFVLRAHHLTFTVSAGGLFLIVSFLPCSYIYVCHGHGRALKLLKYFPPHVSNIFATARVIVDVVLLGPLHY